MSDSGNTTATATIRIPENVVFRRFAAETVVLNIQTGKYHGLNPVAGRMLEVLTDTGSVPEAARRLAEDYGRPVEQIEQDLGEFVDGLSQRGLIEVLPPNGD